MSTAINSNYVMTQDEINELINEFNKDANIIGRMPDVGEFLRAVIIKGGKKHYYFSISAFFDPAKGFLISLAEIYQRYIEIKDTTKRDLMPFTSLMAQPFEKIMGYLDITYGSLLYKSLSIVYSFALGLGVSLIVSGLSAINPVVGFIAGGVALAGYICGAIELYKANDYCKNKEYIYNQGRLFISKIKDLFEKDYNRYLIDSNCNIIEFIVDESFNSILDGIFNFEEKKNNSIIVNYWYIPEIVKAKKIKDFPENIKGMYSYIIENIKFCSDTEGFFRMYEELKRLYHETYKNSNKLFDKANKLDNITEIKKEIERRRKINPNDPLIPILTKIILDMI